jgi:enoyl-[acyl-carrier protein] reductase I
VLELDVNRAEDLDALARELDTRWGGLDGVLHAIAFAPEDALSDFLTTAPESAEIAFRTSAFSLKALCASLQELLTPGASVVAMDFGSPVGWHAYHWMAVAKASLREVARYLARDLGPRGVRVNLVSSGPLRTIAAQDLVGFDGLAAAWTEHAPLGWDQLDPEPVADAVIFLLSRLARAISGEIVHVDGGMHALGGVPLPAPREEVLRDVA